MFSKYSKERDFLSCVICIFLIPYLEGIFFFLFFWGQFFYIFLIYTFFFAPCCMIVEHNYLFEEDLETNEIKSNVLQPPLERKKKKGINNAHMKRHLETLYACNRLEIK
jgi:hypothetical protein